MAGRPCAGGIGAFTGENLLAGPGVGRGGPGGRQHAGDLARSAWSRSNQVVAESQGGRDRGFLWGKDYRCEAGRQAALLLTPREMT